MPGPPTPNLGLTVPTVGGDVNTWGTELNGNLAIIDELGKFNVVSTSTNLTVNLGIFPEIIVFVTTGTNTIGIILPSAIVAGEHAVTIKKNDSAVGIVSITSTAGNIEGQASLELTNQFQYVRVMSDGANWYVVANN